MSILCLLCIRNQVWIHLWRPLGWLARSSNEGDGCHARICGRRCVSNGWTQIESSFVGQFGWWGLWVVLQRLLQRDLLAFVPFNAGSSHFQWEILDGLQVRIEFIWSRESLNNSECYRKVNEDFAEITLKALRKMQTDHPEQVPLVWIHDYHLMLAANTIRQKAEEENLQCKIGFFLHIPFPPWDIMKIFPWEDMILQVSSKA